MTVVELIVDSILRTHNYLQKSGSLKTKAAEEALMDYFSKVLQEGAVECLKGIVRINKMKEQGLNPEEMKT